MKEKISKLPKWAQDYIQKIERERDTAITALNESCDNQTESPFYYEEMLCLGEQKGPSIKRFYIQAYSVSIEHQGVLLNIAPKVNGVALKWDNIGRGQRDIAMIPTSFCAVKLKAKEKMS